MKNTRWTLSAAALCVMALSAYGCSSDPATGDDDADDDTTSSSSSGGKSSSSSGGKSSSSSGGKSSSSSGGSSGNGSSSSGGGSSSSSSGDAGASSSSGDGGGSSSGDGGSGACTNITPDEWIALNANRFGTEFAPQLPGDTANQLTVSFFDGGNAVGSYNLATGANANYATCTQCFEALSAPDAESEGTYFFQSAGTLNVTAIAAGSITATLTGVKLVESTQAAAAPFTTTPVPNGACINVVDGDITVAAP